jgi:hypothetical protein
MSSKQEASDALVVRLQDGFTRIGEAMNNGIEVSNWERHWIELLREYERLNDELAAAPLEQAELALGVREERAA